jgi:hypothetical protein
VQLHFGALALWSASQWLNVSGSGKMKLLAVARVFAFMMFLFVPSIAVLLFAGFILKSTAWFVGLGLPVLLANGIFLLFRPVRKQVSLRLNAMAR